VQPPGAEGNEQDWCRDNPLDAENEIERRLMKVPSIGRRRNRLVGPAARHIAQDARVRSVPRPDGEATSLR
jgi:hypothetical protein